MESHPVANKQQQGQLQESVTAHDSPQAKVGNDKGFDQAYVFLSNAHTSSEIAEGGNINALRRKVDWRIVPIMFLCYTMNLIDKVSLNYAQVMGLTPNLKLKSNDFSNTATFFFAAYLIAEIPTVFILNKVPVAKYLGVNVILWGIATACTAAAHDYHTLLAARIFLGIFEAPIAPCLMLISSQWYTKSEQAPRFAFWYCGLGTGQMIGGIISFAFQHVRKHDFQGWRIMFVVLGCLTVIIGFGVLLILPDSPISARFLSEAEKAAILRHVSVNRTGVLNRNFKLAQIWEALLDLQLWILVLMTILPSISSGVVTSYSATLIKNLGYSSPIAALLNVPSGAVSIVSTLIVGYGVRHASHRWAWYVGSCVPGIIGGGLMSFLPVHNRAGLLIGVWLVNCVVPTVLITYQWTAANVAGHTKRAFSTTLMAAAFGVGNIIGPQTFQARDAPQFIPAKITVLATQGTAAALAVVLFGYYSWVNCHGDRSDAGVDEGATEEEKWSNLTDKENRSFRYVY